MTIFSRIGLVSAYTFAGIVAAAATDGISTPEIRSSVSAIQGGQSFAPKDAIGSYLAIHFLPPTTESAKPHAEIVQDFAAKSEELAGLKQVFVVVEATSWTSNLGGAVALVYVDTANTLASELNVQAGKSPATVVFDPAGRELFRWSGSGIHDHLSFSEFEQKFVKASAAASVGDYNLPKGKNLAIEGYDPVSYFTGGKPEKGSPQIASTWRGVKYQFASKQNRALFDADPDKYAPTYGGWCASAMGAKGTKVEVDPTNFKIKDGRLHLFYKNFFSNALSDWNQHEKEWEPAADVNWQKISGEPPRKQGK